MPQGNPQTSQIMIVARCCCVGGSLLLSPQTRSWDAVRLLKINKRGLDIIHIIFIYNFPLLIHSTLQFAPGVSLCATTQTFGFEVCLVEPTLFAIDSAAGALEEISWNDSEAMAGSSVFSSELGKGPQLEIWKHH